MDAMCLVALIPEALFGAGCVLGPAAALGPFGVTLDDIATPTRVYVVRRGMAQSAGAGHDCTDNRI